MNQLLKLWLILDLWKPLSIDLTIFESVGWTEGGTVKFQLSRKACHFILLRFIHFTQHWELTHVQHKILIQQGFCFSQGLVAEMADVTVRLDTNSSNISTTATPSIYEKAAAYTLYKIGRIDSKNVLNAFSYILPIYVI